MGSCPKLNSHRNHLDLTVSLPFFRINYFLSSLEAVWKTSSGLVLFFFFFFTIKGKIIHHSPKWKEPKCPSTDKIG